jgi:nucleoside-diphosphate-sugar epimerase
MPRSSRGKPVSTLGDPDTPHSWTYLPDVARALAEVAAEERAWGRAWHVPTEPALSARQMVDRLAARAGTGPVAVRALPPAVLGVASLFSPLIRELKEVRYQFERPVVVDRSRGTRHARRRAGRGDGGLVARAAGRRRVTSGTEVHPVLAPGVGARGRSTAWSASTG